MRIFLAVILVTLTAKAPASAVDRDLSSALSHYIMAIVNDDLGNTDRAIKEYEKALSVDAKAAAIHLNLAASLIKKNELSRAIEELKISSRLDPEAVEPHAILAILYSTQNNPELAAVEYELALKNASKLNPKNIDIYKSLGVLYLRQNKLKEAESIFSIVCGLAPGDPIAHFYLGIVYDELKNKALSEKEVKKALELNPDYAEALNFLGYGYVEQNKFLNQAEGLIKKALKLEPDNGAYVDSLGWFYYKKGKLKEAKILLTRSASLMEDPVIYEHLGDVCFKLKDTAGAKLYWQKSLGLDSKQESVKEKLQKLGPK